MSVSDLVGLVGVAAYLSAYALLQLDRLRSDDGAYLLLNAAGSALILFSLVHSFNLPSFVTQTAWLAFTVLGFVRSRRRRGTTPAAAEESGRP